MTTVVAIGESHTMEGFVLAGVRVIRASTTSSVVTAWENLDREVGLVILSPSAAEALGEHRNERADLLTVVTP